MAAASNNNDDSKSTSECSICLVKFTIPKVLPCGHSYCQGCLVPMINRQRQIECPQCRKKAVEPSGGFPTNYALMQSLNNVDDETKEGANYRCSECAKVLGPKDAFLCKGCHDRIICIKCYAANHGAHGGLELLQTLLDNNRPRYERAREKLNAMIRMFNSPETQAVLENHQTIGEKCTNLVLSMNESIADFFKILSGQATLLETALGNHTLESLTISNTGMESLEQLSSCLDEGRLERMFTNAKMKMSFLDEMVRRAEAIDADTHGTEEQRGAANRGNEDNPNAAASSSNATTSGQQAAAAASTALGTGNPASNQVSVISKNQTTTSHNVTNHVEQFNVPNTLMDLVLGTDGENMQRASNIPGVLKIQLEMQDGERFFSVKIVSENADAGRLARNMLEFKEERYLVPRDIVGRIIGKKGRTIQSISEICGTVQMRKANASDQDFDPQDDPVPFIIIGTPETINKAKTALQGHIEHHTALDSMRDALDRETFEIHQQLYGNTRGASSGQRMGAATYDDGDGLSPSPSPYDERGVAYYSDMDSRGLQGGGASRGASRGGAGGFRRGRGGRGNREYRGYGGGQ